jgi:hypothetical protein
VSLEVPSPYVKVYLVESTFGRNTRDMYSKKKTRFVTSEVEFIKKKGGGINREKITLKWIAKEVLKPEVDTEKRRSK